jgi:hypothetical protein
MFSFPKSDITEFPNAKTINMKIMNLLKLVPVIAILTIASCDKSESPTPNVVGSWKLVSSENYDCDIASENGTDVCGTYAWCVTITFNADKTFKIVQTSTNFQTFSGTYSLSPGYLHFTYSNNNGSNSHPIKVSGNTMVLNSTGPTLSCSHNDTYEKI